MKTIKVMNPYTCTSALLSRKEARERRLIGNYGDWLERKEWDFFCTFTTKNYLSMKAARSKMEQLFEMIQKTGTRIVIFWVAEPFDVKEGCHVHALVKISPNGYKALKSAWEVVSQSQSKFTTIEDYEKERGANFYVAKYLQRNGVDYDILCS